MTAELTEPCRICGQRFPLTFEHTPPSAAFNDRRATLYGLQSWLSRGQDGQMRGGRVQQRGMGGRTLCARCNNITGRWYAPELIRWARAGVSALRELPPSAQEDADPRAKMARIRFPRVHPLRFIKQIVAMLLAASPLGRLREDLAPFVLDKQRTGLLPRYAIYLAMVRGSKMRRLGLTSRLRPGSGEVAYLTEIAYPPFAYLLTVDTPQAVLPIGNITHFTQYPYDERCDLQLDLIVGFVHTPFPADYRSRAAIDVQAQMHARETDGETAAG